MINLNEYLLERDLFGTIREVFDFKFFEDNSPEFMNMMAGIYYGKRAVFEPMVERELIDVAKIIVLLHGDKWNQYIHLKALDLDMDIGAFRRIEEEIIDNNNRVNKSEGLNTVSAFNDPELIPNDGNTLEGSEDFAGNKTRTFKDYTSGFSIAYNNLSLLEKTNIIRTVLQDVADTLTLTIYN